MPDYTIRPTEPADIPAITAIYADAVAFGLASFELIPPDESEMHRRFDALMESGHPYLVCEEADTAKLLGYAYAGPHRARPGYRWAVENAVYIAPDAQRRGIGKALLAALIEEATRRSYRQMIAVIGDSANIASIALHENLGFSMVGTLKNVGRKFDRWLDTVLMQRPLGGGGDTPPVD